VRADARKDSQTLDIARLLGWTRLDDRRENMEDYSASFLVLLETWEAAAAFVGASAPQDSQPIDIARLLGWTRLDDRRENMEASRPMPLSL
jgi:hypothetical protein